MIEVWREIIDIPEYEVSNTGFIRNKKTGKILQSFYNRPGGYQRVDLNGKLYYVHRLVYETFNGYIDKNERIMFADGNRRNTSINNLFSHPVGFMYSDEEDFWPNDHSKWW